MLHSSIFVWERFFWAGYLAHMTPAPHSPCPKPLALHARLRPLMGMTHSAHNIIGRYGQSCCMTHMTHGRTAVRTCTYVSVPTVRGKGI
jgi:hypothetical protein